MTISFADVQAKFKGYIDKAKALISGSRPGPALPLPSPTPVEKSETDKLAKTIMPNSVRTITSEPATPAVTAGPRRIAVGGTSISTPADLPRAVAIALEPRVERVLSLPLEDVIVQMPEGYLKPRESFDVSRRVLLKAAEVEKGMASGRPSIPVATLYQQMPEIFMHTVPSSDASLIALPFEKVMHELSNLHVRNDQTSDHVIPQVETPFLHVTMEDTKRFGLPLEPIVTTELPELPPMRVEPATAETIAAAEPEPTVREKFVPPPIGMRPLPTMSRADLDVRDRRISTSDENGESIARPPTARIPFVPSEAKSGSVAPSEKFGTGEPAFPRVPASSGPPVPPPSPVRIPFKPDTPETAPASLKSVPAVQPMLTLPLQPILQSLPPMQLRGDADSVSTDATISFAMTVIAPQLATGKVAIAPRDFHAALPSCYRDLFVPDAIDAAVQLPLRDVLANLPGDALRMRDDQEVYTQDEVFETPFSTKAAEDAQRLTNKVAPALPKMAEPLPLAPATPSVAARTEETPAVTVELPLHPAPTISEPSPSVAAPSMAAAAPHAFDAKEAVAKACKVVGVQSCNISFADGLRLAGNIPEDAHLEGLSAVAPTLLQKLEKHMLETHLGPLTCLTLHGDNSPVSFFTAGNICLTALHGSGDLCIESRRELASLTHELSRTYSQPDIPHVDH